MIVGVIIDPSIDIIIFAFIFAIISTFLQRKFGNLDATKNNQKQMQEKQKEANELMKKNDKASQEKALKLQEEMIKISMETMKGSMKYMVITMIVFIPLLGFLQMQYSHFKTFYITIDAFLAPWIWWYLICSIVSTLLIQQVIIKMILKK